MKNNLFHARAAGRIGAFAGFLNRVCGRYIRSPLRHLQKAMGIMSQPKIQQPQNAVAEHLHFLGRLVKNPRNVGAVAPSGPGLARAMVSQMDMGMDGPVLELGPGPGAITRELLAQGLTPSRLTVIERDPDFVDLIRSRFEGVNAVHGDAFAFRKDLEAQGLPPFAAILSGLPLLNFPLEQRTALLKDIMATLKPGAPFIQFSYGLKSPVPAIPGVNVRHAAFVWKNLPPAHVWVYRQA